VVAISSGEVGSALKRRYSSLLSLVEFWQCSSWFLGILCDTDSTSMDLLDCGL
jgi:hypothetical protein